MRKNWAIEGEEFTPELKLIEFFKRDQQKRELLELFRLYPEKKTVVVDFLSLQAFGREGLYYCDSLLTRPRAVLPDFENALHELAPKALQEELLRNVTFRFKNIPRKVMIRAIRSTDLNRFITFDGVARMVGQVKPKISMAIFDCSNCSHSVRVMQRTTKLEYPTDGTCAACGERAKWEINLERSAYVNSQKLVMQEFQEGLKASEQPYTIDVEMLDDLCGIINAGSRVSITGIPRVIEKGKKDLMVDLIIESNWLDLGDQSFNDIEITEAEEEEIRALASDKNILHRFASSIAPSIYGHEIVKSAIALQMFRGVTRQRGKNRTRGDIHILLLGDPGIAKSQLLDFTAATTPRGVSASGGQSTNAGLTCAAKQSPDGDWMLEGGALVLADGGICCIDEFDKMSKDDRAAIHKAMEQQKIDVNKAGLNSTLMTRCSVLAAANPKSGRWDPFGNIGEQIDLPPSLLSRFDLIFIMRDVPEPELDARIAGHILRGDDIPDGLDPEMMRKYIALAQRTVKPERDAVADQVLTNYYLKLRRSNKDGTVPITPRKLEDLKRLTEASARLRLSEVATEDDANIAVMVVDACLRDVAYDPKTGNYDIDRVISNVSGAQRKEIEVVHTFLKSSGKPMCYADIYLGCQEYLTKEAVDRAIGKMSDNVMVSVSADKKVTLV